ncbi:MAG: LPS export ABC transporter periplasmic protein LptC [Candidatus Atribacteria bacterium]|nr:LPS export ABC transporter periplasmic protein LptC [Candidatus Atribacteria bacterium]MCD6349181.1 LPS export ABC transporter periplasmic protein LptC [Candidatus Atribacteria bacterium]
MKRLIQGRALNVLIVALFLVVASLVVVFLLRSSGGLGEESEEKAGAERTEEVTEFGIKLRGIVIRGWDGDLLQWLLEAPQAQLDKGITRMHCEGGVLVSVFNEEGNLRSKINANRAELDLIGDVFSFRNQVEAKSASGDRLFSEELTYYPEEEKVVSQSLVKVFFDHNFIESKGLVSDIDFERPYFVEVVSGRFQIGN